MMEKNKMSLNDLRSALSGKITANLNGLGNYRQASVFVIIYGKEPAVLMTKKPPYMKFHAGEISFPGGKMDADDSDLLQTALREIREEIGLEVSRESVIGQLDPVITMSSGFMILPLVAILETIPLLVANSEVEEIFYIPLRPFLHTMSRDRDPTHNEAQNIYTFEYKNQIVWGASAKILKQIRDILKL